jgi:hypothetical protein
VGLDFFSGGLCRGTLDRILPRGVQIDRTFDARVHYHHGCRFWSYSPYIQDWRDRSSDKGRRLSIVIFLVRFFDPDVSLPFYRESRQPLLVKAGFTLVTAFWSFARGICALLISAKGHAFLSFLFRPTIRFG